MSAVSRASVHASTSAGSRKEGEQAATENLSLNVSRIRGIRHVLSDCTGTWREERVWDQDYLACAACGARHHATPALRAAAHDENERGRLLDALAAEGRFLP